MKIAVYCSASETIRSLFLEDAAELGTAIAKQGHDLIFGGGNIGSMGRLEEQFMNRRVELFLSFPNFLMIRV